MTALFAPWLAVAHVEEQAHSATPVTSWGVFAVTNFEDPMDMLGG